MSREWPIPSVANTLHVVGDPHHNGDAFFTPRLAKLQADILKLPVYPRLYIGDITHTATSPEDAVALAWMDDVPGGRFGVCGNHDVWLNGRTLAEWSLLYGFPQNWTADLGFVRLVGVAPDAGGVAPYVLSEATLEWLDETLAASAKDCWVCCHYPLYNTVLDVAGDPQNISTHDSFHIKPDADVRAILSSRARAKAWVAGHTHSRIDAQDLIKLEDVGVREVVSVNTSAPAYTGNQVGYNDPIHSPYLSLADGEIQVRFRNHGAGVWDAVPGWGRVASVPVPA